MGCFAEKNNHTLVETAALRLKQMLPSTLGDTLIENQAPELLFICKAINTLPVLNMSVVECVVDDAALNASSS